MVASRLLEMTNKGTEWAYGTGPTTGAGTSAAASAAVGTNTNDAALERPPPITTTTATTAKTTTDSSYLNYANKSFQFATDTTYSTLASLVSSLYKGGSTPIAASSSSASSQWLPSTSSISQWLPSTEWLPSTNSMFSLAKTWTIGDTGADATDVPYDDADGNILSPRNGGTPRRSSTARRASAIHLSSILQNPYNSVRGRHQHPSSMSAVRSLITLVPFHDDDDDDVSDNAIGENEKKETEFNDEDPRLRTVKEDDISEQGELRPGLETSWSEGRDRRQRTQQQRRTTVSSAETASQLAEGTLRALRDMALDEAVELHQALHFWSDRWERPLLSWLEAGPAVWLSPEGYNHQVVGQKVSQIQAVLARRCASIGELQQHLLRAGWQRGVAQWGVLGQGGQWAAVAGFDGTIVEEAEGSMRTTTRADRRMSSAIDDISTIERQRSGDLSETVFDRRAQRHASSRVGQTDSHANAPEPGSAANIFVRNRDGGGIYIDDPAFLTRWSIDAIQLVRAQLNRAANGMVLLPYASNWLEESSANGEGQLIVDQEDTVRCKLPFWAHDRSDTMSSSASLEKMDRSSQLAISDLPLMLDEVSELLDVMEDIMLIQRQRRLEKMRPLGWIRRHWYLAATILPSATYLVRQVARQGFAKELINSLTQKVSVFFLERLFDPISAILHEIWKGRESFSDKKARMDAIVALKQMIRSWLDDTFPSMKESERIAMAEAMDMSLIEQKKEEGMRTFYEINNVVRMSFIEMQYMKKEMMSAIEAMDEMMSANDINMNLAAITPALIVSYAAQRIFGFLFYALLELGKSQEETYASFRNILTDIERLLVMRDNPPTSLPLTNFASQPEEALLDYSKPCVLGGDDLGMLMLLLHECRTVMWRDRKRFPVHVIRSVSEDLAELAGERGAVSVQQQLQIITRMTRTYPFLKVISTGHMFSYSKLRTS